jgi:cytochrome P450
VRANPSLLADVVERGNAETAGNVAGAVPDHHKRRRNGGATVPEGSLVWLLFIGGGLDESHFPNSEKWNIHRSNRDKHLAFGYGRHACLGSPLARLEARVAFEELLRRIPEIWVKPGQTLEYLPNLTVTTLNQLPAEWTPLATA